MMGSVFSSSSQEQFLPVMDCEFLPCSLIFQDEFRDVCPLNRSLGAINLRVRVLADNKLAVVNVPQQLLPQGLCGFNV